MLMSETAKEMWEKRRKLYGSSGIKDLEGLKNKLKKNRLRSQRISEALQGHPMSTETKTKISLAMQGNTPWNKGKKGVQKCSEETRAKMSLSHSNYKPTPESNLKRSLALKGRIITPLWRQHISESTKGKKHCITEETRKNMSVSARNRSEVTSQQSLERWKDPDFRKKVFLSRSKSPRRGTSIEKILEEQVSNMGIPYSTQHPVGHISIVDFFIPPNFCLFADGDYWHNRLEVVVRDDKQNIQLKELGFNVLRFWEHEPHDDPLVVSSRLNEVLQVK